MKGVFLPVSILREGMLTASDVYDKWGRCVMKAQTEITKDNIRYLRHRGFTGVYIDAERTSHKKIMSVMDTLCTSLSDPSSECYQRAIREVKSDIEEIIQLIFSSSLFNFDIKELRVYNKYTYNHSIEVAAISLLIGLGMGLTKEYLEELYIASLFHDIGKLTLPIRILDKPGRLTNEEFKLVKNHPTTGANLMRNTPLSTNGIYKGILYHHENWDGTGYPSKLVRDEIPLYANIIHVADVYNALTTNRPYRNKDSYISAYDYILHNSGMQFCPEVVDVFKRRIQPLHEGSLIKLSNGDNAIVVKKCRDNALYPEVMLLDKGITVNLKTSNLHIVGQYNL